MLQTNDFGYEVKGVIDGIGHDQTGFKANLYLNNKLIAEVQDDGWGGEYQYYFKDPAKSKEFDSFIEEQKILREKTFVPKDDLEKELGFIFNHDCFVCDLIQMYYRVKAMKKACKNNVVIQVGKDINTDLYLRLPGQSYSTQPEKIKQFLNKKYPKDRILILNEFFGIN